MKRLLLVCALVLAQALLAVPGANAGTAPVYKVQLDGLPPKHDNWSFLRYFPRTITVHRGAVVEAAWAGAGAPHTATMVPEANADTWRQQNQDPGDPYAFVVPDSAVGGDDSENVVNPAAAFPSDPTCGSEAGNACAFDGTSVVNSGFMFGDPSNEPSFFVKMDAPVGTYSFLCLVHPGMEMTVNVVGKGQAVPTPSQIQAKATTQFAKATNVWGPAADFQAQQVVSGPVDGGHTSYTLWAGGFSHNVSADEYPDKPLTIHVGDKVQFLGNYEIHTATIPASSIGTVPLITTQCEVPGPDTSATSPADCSDPTKFQIAFNNEAVVPSASSTLTDPTAFVNSGLLSAPSSTTFVADAPGTYTVICLVHGPAMSTTIKVAA